MQNNRYNSMTLDELTAVRESCVNDSQQASQTHSDLLKQREILMDDESSLHLNW